MRKVLDPLIRRELKRFPVEYEIVKSRDHYWLAIDGEKKVIVAGNHGRYRTDLLSNSLQGIRRLRSSLEAVRTESDER